MQTGEQVSTTTPPTSETPNAGDQPSGQVPDVQALIAKAVAEHTAPLQSELEKANAELKKVRDEAARRRVEKNEASQAAAKAAEEQQQYKVALDETKALLESTKAQLAELQQERDTLRPLAERYTGWEKQQLESIKTRESQIPDGPFKDLLAAQSTVEGKLKVIAAYDEAQKAAQGTKPEHKPPTDGPPAGADPTSSPWDKLKRDGGGGMSARLRASAVRAKG